MGSLKVNEMHRAYQPITAANNKLLKKRWDQRTYDLHRAKVHTSKAMIDNHAPETYMHMHLKLKKLQMEEERLAVVERDNRILLENELHYENERSGRQLEQIHAEIAEQDEETARIAASHSRKSSDLETN